MNSRYFRNIIPSSCSVLIMFFSPLPPSTKSSQPLWWRYNIKENEKRKGNVGLCELCCTLAMPRPNFNAQNTHRSSIGRRFVSVVNSKMLKSQSVAHFFTIFAIFKAFAWTSGRTMDKVAADCLPSSTEITLHQFHTNNIYKQGIAEYVDLPKSPASSS